MYTFFFFFLIITSILSTTEKGNENTPLIDFVCVCGGGEGVVLNLQNSGNFAFFVNHFYIFSYFWSLSTHWT